MALVAHSSELSLFDLIQVKGIARATCRIAVNGGRAPGVLFLQRGVAVFASYDGCSGEEAAYAILREPQLEYSLTSDTPIPAWNMHLEHQALVMEAARRLDESTPPSAYPLRPSGRRARWTWLVFPIAVLAGSAGAALWTSLRDGAHAPARAPAFLAMGEAAAASAVEASALLAPQDRLPALATWTSPASPHPDVPLRPTIVCRLLIDAAGAVVRAEVYQPRTGFDDYEAAALSAVKAYRFEPALRGGVPAAVWINWPVAFQELPRPRLEP